ncbi:MAG TPA: hypothetical protein VHW00_00945 [Thermoanaerobaculia bacterium]|nr:hypothetical protein [Thermoanaerobaculia bacterium]
MKRLLVLLVLLTACGGSEPPAAPKPAAETPATPPPPSAAETRALIANSAEFGEFEFTNAAFTTPVNLATASEPVRASAKELAAAGWISIDGGTVALTEKSRGDKRFLMRENGILDVVPLAKKEMGDVRNVQANPDGTATADFTWTWNANEVGSAFRSGTLYERYHTPRTSKATLIWDGTSWSVLKME